MKIVIDIISYLNYTCIENVHIISYKDEVINNY
jgi:hypothetical protein